MGQVVPVHGDPRAFPRPPSCLFPSMGGGSRMVGPSWPHTLTWEILICSGCIFGPQVRYPPPGKNKFKYPPPRPTPPPPPPTPGGRAGGRVRVGGLAGGRELGGWGGGGAGGYLNLFFPGGGYRTVGPKNKWDPAI